MALEAIEPHTRENYYQNNQDKLYVALVIEKMKDPRCNIYYFFLTLQLKNMASRSDYSLITITT
jgi:hypothetical protein